MENHIHQELFREFSEKYKFQLAGYSENVIWFYFDVDRVYIEGSSAIRTEIVDIIRKTDDTTIDRNGSNKRSRLE
jgi:hypothetical protein